MSSPVHVIRDGETLCGLPAMDVEGWTQARVTCSACEAIARASCSVCMGDGTLWYGDDIAPCVACHGTGRR